MIISATFSKPVKNIQDILGRPYLRMKIRAANNSNSTSYMVEAFTEKQAFHEQKTEAELNTFIEKHAGITFKNCVIRTESEEITILGNKKGETTRLVKKLSAAQKTVKQNIMWNKQKNYLLAEGTPVPFLVLLGVMTPEGRVVNSKYDKFRQINRFLEFINDILPQVQPEDKSVPIRIADFGCGKSYLTFAMYHYLKVMKGFDIRVIGLDLKEADLSMLGRAKSVKVQKENTVIVDGMGNKARIAGRVAQIKAQIEQTTSDYDREKLQERLAKLAGGVAVLYIGAPSEVEMKEKKDRVDDALAATRAAVEEGIVPGGGVAYIRATATLEGLKGDNDDQTTGIQIVKRAIEEPLRQIVSNAGGEGSVVVNKVREGVGNFGYNAREDRFEDMLAAGIIDPTKVSRVALENAASIASMFLTTECVLAEKPSENPLPAMPAGGMGGMM